jgi:hypothetical protein
MKKRMILIVGAFGLFVTGAAYAGFGPDRIPVEFYHGHSHAEDGTAIDAPEHSGGTDRYGCHNGSVPYHCH